MRPVKHLWLIGVGGSLGALLRWRIAEAWAGSVFPWPTLLVNVIGCALLSLLVSTGVSGRANRLLAVGFCGGLTTFSTLTVEIVQMHDGGHVLEASLYIAASLVLGLGVYIGLPAIFGRFIEQKVVK